MREFVVDRNERKSADGALQCMVCLAKPDFATTGMEFFVFYHSLTAMLNWPLYCDRHPRYPLSFGGTSSPLKTIVFRFLPCSLLSGYV